MELFIPRPQMGARMQRRCDKQMHVDVPEATAEEVTVLEKVQSFFFCRRGDAWQRGKQAEYPLPCL
jgi:hypothetical protein